MGLSIRRNAERSFRRGLEWDLAWRPEEALAFRFTGSWSWNRIRSWTQFYEVYDDAGEWAGTTSRTFADVEPVSLEEGLQATVDWFGENTTASA